MTLSPVWDETFFLSPETPRGRDASARGTGADGDGIRFEMWDHDLHGQGDYLGTRITRFVACFHICSSNWLH